MENNARVYLVIAALVECAVIAVFPGTENLDKEERVSLDRLVKLVDTHINLSYAAALDKWHNNIPIEVVGYKQHLMNTVYQPAVDYNVSIDEAFDFLDDQMKGSQIVESEMVNACEVEGELYAKEHIYGITGNYSLDKVYKNMQAVRTQMIYFLSRLKKFRGSNNCSTVVANMVFHLHTRGHQKKTDLRRIALQRSLGSFCTRLVPQGLLFTDAVAKRREKEYNRKKKMKNLKKEKHYKEMRKKQKEINRLKKELKKRDEELKARKEKTKEKNETTHKRAKKKVKKKSEEEEKEDKSS